MSKRKTRPRHARTPRHKRNEPRRSIALYDEAGQHLGYLAAVPGGLRIVTPSGQPSEPFVDVFAGGLLVRRALNKTHAARVRAFDRLRARAAAR